MNAVKILTGFYPIVAVFTGLMIGLYLEQHPDQQQFIFYLEFPALLLLNVLKLLIVPYVVACIITIITTIGTMGSTRLMALTLAYYAITNGISVILAASLSILLFEFTHVLTDKMLFMATEGHRVRTIEEIISLIFPEDVLAAIFEKTLYMEGKKICIEAEGNSTSNCTSKAPIKVIVKEPNYMGLMFFAVCFGCIINHMGSKGRPLRMFFHSIDAVVFMGVKFFLWYIPLGSMFLLAIYTSSMTNLPDFMILLLALNLVYLLALFIHCCLTLPIVLFICTQQQILPLVCRLKAALLNSFLAASSSAALPETLNRVTQKTPSRQNKGARHVCMVLCATLIKDGSTIYLVITSYFIIRTHHDDLSGVELAIICLCSVVASMVTAGLPQSGLISLAIVLSCAGTPLSCLVYIVASEWITDHLSSPANVWSSYVGAEVIYFYVTHFNIGEKFQEPEPARHVVILRASKNSRRSSAKKSKQSMQSNSSEGDFDEDEDDDDDDDDYDDEVDEDTDSHRASTSSSRRESSIS